MAAKAVIDVSTTGAVAATPLQRNTLTLPAGTLPAPRQPAAEVVIFQEASAARPKPYVTTDEEAAAALQRRQQSHDRERLSRERGAEILRRRRAGEAGSDDGQAMLARPYRKVPIAFLSDETLEAALTRQFADAHQIDCMWDQGQLNDWQYATANRLLQLCEQAGLLASKVAQVGRIGAGHAEMSDGMAKARRQLNRLMTAIGYPGSELLIDLCLGALSYGGKASRAEALKGGLRHLAQHWGIDRS